MEACRVYQRHVSLLQLLSLCLLIFTPLTIAHDEGAITKEREENSQLKKVSSLCTAMIFTYQIFYLESQTIPELDEILPSICKTYDCTEFLQHAIYNKHRYCLFLSISEQELPNNDIHNNTYYNTNEYILTNVVDGLCITKVSKAYTARFYSPSLEVLDKRLEDFLIQNNIQMNHFSTIRDYVLDKCFPSSTDNISSDISPLTPRYKDLEIYVAHRFRTVNNKRKQMNSQQVIDNVISTLKQSNSHVGSNGHLVIPLFKLSVCIPPKSGLVSVLFLLLAILGKHPDEICGCHGVDVDSKFGCLGMNMLRHYSHPMYKGMIYLNDAIRYSEYFSKINNNKNKINFNQSAEQLFQTAFTHPDWTTIMFVRYPWRRAISAFHEDNGYQGWINITEKKNDILSRRKEMLKYLKDHVYNHGMPASSFCNLRQGLEFDHYYDIDKGFDKLQQIFDMTSPPIPRFLLDSGWESCTIGNNPSIVNSRLKTTHTWSETQSELDDIYCTPTIVKEVVKHFKEDYRYIVPHLNYSVFPACLKHEDILEMLTED